MLRYHSFTSCSFLFFTLDTGNCRVAAKPNRWNRRDIRDRPDSVMEVKKGPWRFLGRGLFLLDFGAQWSPAAGSET